MLSTYERIGIASEYSECIRSYASVAAGGQVTSSGGGNMLGSLLGGLLGGGSSGAAPAARDPPAPARWEPCSRPSSSRAGLQQVHRARADGSAGWLDVDRMTVRRRVLRGQPVRRLGALR